MEEVQGEEVAELKYKEHTFKLKSNRFSVSRYLLPLQAKMRKMEREATKETVRNPDYIRYSNLMDEMNQVSEDLERTKELEPKTEAEEKTKAETIATTERHLREYEKKLREPALVDIAQEYMDEIIIVRMPFFYDTEKNPENIKVLCKALLQGDLSVIDFEDGSIWDIADTLIEFFFQSENKTRKQNSTA